MPRIRIHYDGWISLPATARRALRLQAGDELAAEVKEGALVLRPITRSSGRKDDAPAAEPAEPAGVSADVTPPRKRGRPRKTAAPAPPPIKARGRRKSSAAAPPTSSA